MLITTHDLIIEKAKTKADGCYRIRCVAYRVRDNKVTHMAQFGEIFERCYGFNVLVGTYPDTIASDEAGQKLLRKIK